MATETTATRKPRTRKPAEPETPVLAAWPRFDHEAWDELVKAASEAQSTLGPVPRFWTQPDLEALRRIDADAAELAADAIAEAGEKADAAHRAVNSGWSLAHPLKYDGGAYKAAYRGEPMTDCGATPPLPFHRPQAAIPVRGASPFGTLDADQRRRCDAVFGPEDASGPAEADPPAGPEEDRSEEMDDPALGQAPVLVIDSNPVKRPLGLAPSPIPVGEWKKPGEGGAKT